MRWGRDVPLRWMVASGYAAALLTTMLLLGLILQGLVSNYLWWSTRSRMMAQARTALGVEDRGPRAGEEAPPPPDVQEGRPRRESRRGRGLEEIAAMDPDRLVRTLAETGLSARVMDVQGKVLAEHGAGVRMLPLPTAEQLAASFADPRGGPTANSAYVTEAEARRRSHFVVVIPLGPPEEPTRYLQLASSWRPAQELLTELGRLLGWMGLVAVVLGVLVSFVLARAITRPLERLAQTARRVADGDLAARTGLTPGRSEIRAVAAAFDDMVDRLQKAFAAQKRFVADASHELRTPLTTIGGMAELLPQATNEERVRALAAMEREVERMSRLVDDLLTLSRAEDETPAPRRVPVDLAPVLREAVEGAGFASRGREIRLQIEEPVPTLGDPDALGRAIRNVLDNALQYSPPGTPVEVEAAVREGWIQVRVRDQGPGIPAADLPRIFDRFYRADLSRARRTGGSGLGLSIVRAIVEDHGGRAAVRNGEEGGTEVTLSLPAGEIGAPGSKRP